MEALQRVIEAHREAQRIKLEAQERLVAVIAEVHAEGVPLTTLAPALGVTRVTLWRWLEGLRQDAPPHTTSKEAIGMSSTDPLRRTTASGWRILVDESDYKKRQSPSGITIEERLIGGLWHSRREYPDG